MVSCLKTLLETMSFSQSCRLFCLSDEILTFFCVLNVIASVCAFFHSGLLITYSSSSKRRKNVIYDILPEGTTIASNRITVKLFLFKIIHSFHRFLLKGTNKTMKTKILKFERVRKRLRMILEMKRCGLYIFVSKRELEESFPRSGGYHILQNHHLPFNIKVSANECLIVRKT